MYNVRIPQGQIEQADHCDLVSFLRTRGETLVREGNEYRWPDHQGTTIKGNLWCQRGCNNLGGGAISFVMHFFDVAFPDAVRMLTGNEVISSPVTQPAPRKPFCLPPRSATNDAVIKYLTIERKIPLRVIDPFIQRCDIYQEDQCGFCNAVFVGRDKDGIPRSAHRKGIGPQQFRRDVAGSRKDYGFAHIGEEPTVVFVESAIDLLSFIAIYPPALSCSLISCGGTSDAAVNRFLADHPETETVVLAFDSDDAGNKGCELIRAKIPSRIALWRMVPREKDWNDVLKSGDLVNASTRFRW